MMNMLKRCVVAGAVLIAVAGCSETTAEIVAPDEGAANQASEAALPTALELGDDVVVDELDVEEREGATGVDELIEQPEALPVLDSDGGSSPDPYNGLDIDESEIGIETADYSFEARDQPAGFTGIGDSISVPVNSTVAFSLVTAQLGDLIVDELDVSTPTNGDVGQVVFETTEVGLFPIVLRVDGNERVITTLVVDG